MKPLNLDNSPCSPISSNCVIWQGPSIPCINLCTGDTITDVVYALAIQLCNVVDAVNISTLDLSCLEITTGTPSNINQLLQILIDKICETNSIPSPSAFPTRGNTSCPTDCIVPVADCLQSGGQTTMKLLDYVQMIGNTICSIIDEITTINNSITNITNRVIALESIPPTPPYVLPPVTPICTLSPSIPGGVSAPLNFVLDALINDLDHGYCALLGAAGQPSDITIAYNLGNSTVSGTDGALSNCSLTLDQLFSTTWITAPTNLSESFIDLWLVVKDIRDAYKRYNVVAGNSNVTVTTTTTPDSCGPEISFDIKAKSSSVSAGTNIVSVVPTTTGYNTDYVVNAKNTTVVAGDNITVAENTSDPANTIYTVTGKEAIVTASTDTTNTVTVTPTTSGNDTTYAVYSKYGLDTFIMGWSMKSDRYCSWTDIPPVPQTAPVVSVVPPCYAEYVTTGYGIPVYSGGQRILKPNFIQTTGSVGAYANKNVTVTHYGMATYLTTTDFQNYGNTFGILDSDSGIFTITQAGVYTISAHMHLKTNCDASSAPLEGQYFWDTVDGYIGLGIVDAASTKNIFCGNFQPVIANKTTQIDLTTTRTVYLSANTELGLNILNITGRTYTANNLTGGDGISLQVTKISEGVQTITL